MGESVQIFMRGNRVWKINNNGASATSASASIYYFSADAEPRFINYQNFTPATATSTSASIVVHDTYNVYENPVPLSTGNDIA